MTQFWTPVPQWLALDAGVLALPASAQVSLYRIAMAGGSVSCGASPEAALDALCAGASSSLHEMRELGVLSLDERRLYLMAPDGLRSAVAATGQARAGAPTAGEGDDARRTVEARQKRLSALWAKAGAKTLEQRLSWLDGRAGASFAERERLTLDAVAEMTRASTGSNRGRFGSPERGSNHGSNSGEGWSRDGSNHGSNQSPSQTLPLREKNEETSGERARGTAPTYGSNPHGSNLQPTAPTVEAIGAKIEPDVVIDAMGKASGGLVVLAGSAPEMSSFGETLRGYVAQGHALPAIVAATQHLAHGHWTQRKARTALSPARLVAAGHNGKPSILTELLTESATCAECQRALAPKHPLQPEAPAVLTRKITSEEASAIRAAVRANAEAKRKETAHVRD